MNICKQAVYFYSLKFVKIKININYKAKSKILYKNKTINNIIIIRIKIKQKERKNIVLCNLLKRKIGEIGQLHSKHKNSTFLLSTYIFSYFHNYNCFQSKEYCYFK